MQDGYKWIPQTHLSGFSWTLCGLFVESKSAINMLPQETNAEPLSHLIYTSIFITGTSSETRGSLSVPPSVLPSLYINQRAYYLPDLVQLARVHDALQAALAIKKQQSTAKSKAFLWEEKHPKIIRDPAYFQCPTIKAFRQTLKSSLHWNGSWKECSRLIWQNIWLNQRPLETAKRLGRARNSWNDNRLSGRLWLETL